MRFFFWVALAMVVLAAAIAGNILDWAGLV